MQRFQSRHLYANAGSSTGVVCCIMPMLFENLRAICYLLLFLSWYRFAAVQRVVRAAYL